MKPATAYEQRVTKFDKSDGFLQHSLTFAENAGYLFYGGGLRLDTGDGKDLRLHADFFTPTAPWPYGWQGRPRTGAELETE